MHHFTTYFAVAMLPFIYLAAPSAVQRLRHRMIIVLFLYRILTKPLSAGRKSLLTRRFTEHAGKRHY